MYDAPHRCYRVIAVRQEGAVGATLTLDGDLPAEPGQFVMVWLPGVGERPFAVMDDAPLRLTVARVGPFTEALAARQTGERVWVRGPFGHGFSPPGQRLLLIGGGSGTASLTLLARRARADGRQVVATVGARTAEGLMLLWRYRELGCETLPATDDGSLGHRGTALAAAETLLAARWPEAVYACGPEPMLLAAARRCDALALPCWVSLERVMKCGLGLCGACHCGEYLVCADGPVFAAGVLLESAEA